MHEHFDADGNKTGHTVVTRESPWDDVSRARALRLAEYENSLCSCGCGQPREVAQDPKQIFRVESVKCGANRAIRLAEDADAAKRKDSDDETWGYGLMRYAVPIDDPRPQAGGDR